MTRLATGGLIDRARPLGFDFDGKRFTGYAGDTLASALIANDVKLVGRSFKYHRPRGILTATGEEPNALVRLRMGSRAEPNSRATTVELFDGLVATSQNRWPSLALDLLAVNQLFSPFLVAGFYYKTFMWPARLWERLYEPLIRRAAGLGRLSMLPDPDLYDREHGFCDLLVIGGGPAGLAAALTAGRAGLRVILADEDAQFGGRLLSERHRVNEVPGSDWAARTIAELATMPQVRLLARTSVFGVYDGREYAAVERVGDHLPTPVPGKPRQRLWKIVARRSVLASGAIERPIVFGGNDRPGVMLASAVSTYLNRHAAVAGGRVVIFTTADSGWQTAADLVAAGVNVIAVIEARNEPPTIAHSLVCLGVEVHLGARVTDARGSPLAAVDFIAGGKRRRIRADLLAVAGGWDPAIGLASNMGARPRWSEALGCFLADATPPGMVVAGAAAGHLSLGAVMRDGVGHAISVLADLGRSGRAEHFTAGDEASSSAPLWFIPERRTKAFVDFQNDVTDADVALATREGFVSVEHLKRYTTLGMGTDQGKTSQLNGQALLASATGVSISQAGTIMSRPPWRPVAIGVLAGHQRDERFRPERLTASHAWASAQGAIFVDVGLWKRPQYFPRPGDRDWRDAVNREVQGVRGGVGICDVSTLGKIDIQGPDAGALLDRLYTNLFSSLPVGKARYGLMLREDGFAFDDGTATRFAEDRYFVTTTTANAARVMQHIDFARQVLWPELDVQAASVTEQWATFAVAGPASRALMQRVFPDLDLSNAAFPYMAAAEVRWRDIPARVFRLSFSGELAFEVSVPALHGERLLRQLFEFGAPLGATPYGTEALGVMRIEKGHVAGPELNGRTTAADLGMARMLSTKKDFIGRAMAERPGLTDPARPALVGLTPIDPTGSFLSGAHLIDPGRPAVAANDQGHVSSAGFSPTLGHSIALAFLSHGTERHGERITAHDPVRGHIVEARICNPVFVDPQGARLRG